MATPQITRWLNRLTDLPQLALPTDYPRPTGESMVEAQEKRLIDERTASSLLRLALFADEEELDSDQEEEEESEEEVVKAKNGNGIEGTLVGTNGVSSNGSRSHLERPTAFHLLLASFVVLLHRYTGDLDIILATSSPSSPSPLLLRIKLDPTDSYWSLVKRIQWVEQEAEEDKIPYEVLLDALNTANGVKGDGGDGGVQNAVPLFRVRFIDETDETERSFLQSTSLTSDLTVFVTSTLPSTPTARSSSLPSGTGTPTSLRTSLLPTISLTLSYNSLVFSSPRMSYTIDQLLHLVQHASLHPLDSIGSISLLTSKQRKLLPDPKKDLEWTGFRGAITDIFSANAKRWPERVCIVESLPSDVVGGCNGLRSFSYKQIDEASNVLAHHLIKGGVLREEVVTVYSTRGVDLVVAVMGVLKAGATFSVIGKFLLFKSIYRKFFDD